MAGGGAANLSQNTMSSNHCSWQNQLQPSGRKSKYFLSIYVSNPHPLPAERYLPRNQWHLICSFLQQSLLRISQQTQPFWIQRMNRPNVMQNYKLRIQRLQPKIFSDYQNLFVSASRTNEFSYLALVWCDPWRSWPLPPLENPRCCWTISMLSLHVGLLLCETGNLSLIRLSLFTFTSKPVSSNSQILHAVWSLFIFIS